jgi:hypothetical protein
VALANARASTLMYQKGTFSSYVDILLYYSSHATLALHL